MQDWVKQIIEKNNPKIEFVDINGLTFMKEKEEENE